MPLMNWYIMKIFVNLKFYEHTRNLTRLINNDSAPVYLLFFRTEIFFQSTPWCVSDLCTVIICKIHKEVL